MKVQKSIILDGEAFTFKTITARRMKGFEQVNLTKNFSAEIYPPDNNRGIHTDFYVIRNCEGMECARIIPW